MSLFADYVKFCANVGFENNKQDLNFQVNKSQKGLPLETKNTQNHENRRLGYLPF